MFAAVQNWELCALHTLLLKAYHHFFTHGRKHNYKECFLCFVFCNDFSSEIPSWHFEIFTQIASIIHQFQKIIIFNVQKCIFCAVDKRTIHIVG